jgi:hypothetical protein
MTETRLPSPEEIRTLTDFLPVFYAEGFDPEATYRGCLSSPDYAREVYAFVDHAGQPPWLDYQYSDRRRASGPIEQCSLAEIRAHLTHFVRGENFCGGWWAGRIADGELRRILERLLVLNGDA